MENTSPENLQNTAQATPTPPPTTPAAAPTPPTPAAPTPAPAPPASNTAAATPPTPADSAAPVTSAGELKDPSEIASDEKLFSALGYAPLLFVLPSAFKPKSAFCQKHAKQGMMLSGGFFVALLAMAVIPSIGLLLFLGVIVLMAMGALKAYSGKEWHLTKPVNASTHQAAAPTKLPASKTPPAAPQQQPPPPSSLPPASA